MLGKRGNIKKKKGGKGVTEGGYALGLTAGLLTTDMYDSMQLQHKSDQNIVTTKRNQRTLLAFSPCTYTIANTGQSCIKTQRKQPIKT